MTTLVEIRNVLVNHMVTNFSGTPVIYENRSVDMDRVDDRFIRFCVYVDDTQQANIAPNPFHRYYGRVEMQVFTKIGLGTNVTLALMDELTGIFKCKVVGGKVHTQVPTPSRVEEHDGWYCHTFVVPFFADSNT